MREPYVLGSGIFQEKFTADRLREAEKKEGRSETFFKKGGVLNYDSEKKPH